MALERPGELPAKLNLIDDEAHLREAASEAREAPTAETPVEPTLESAPEKKGGISPEGGGEAVSPTVESPAEPPSETAKERVEPVMEEPQVEKPKTYTFHFDEGGKAHLENEARLEKEAQELRPELEKTPEAEREKIGVGFRNVGFHVEEIKNNFFAGVFNKIAGTQTQEKSTTTRFITKLGEGFERDAKKARERMETIEKTKNRETLANAGYLLGNTIKYGRTVLDIAGVTVAAPLRFATMGAMAFSRGADAAKEMRLENEKVVGKTRLDEDKALEEAARLYDEEARKKGAMSANEIAKTYRESLPKDILARLETKTPEQPSLVNRVVQGILRTHIERSVKRLERKTEKIGEDKKLSAKEKSAKRERLFNHFDRRLRDYDRVVGQFGTVDALAMGARYAEVVGKVAAYVPTAYIALEKAFEAVGDTFSSVETGEAVDGLRDVATGEVPPPGSLPPIIESGGAPKLQSEIIENLKEHAGIPKMAPAHISETIVSHEMVNAHSADAPIEAVKDTTSKATQFSPFRAGAAFGMPNAPIETSAAEITPTPEAIHAASAPVGGRGPLDLRPPVYRPEFATAPADATRVENAAIPKAQEQVEAMARGNVKPIEIGLEQIKLATIEKGEGVTHAIKRQLMQHAEQYGYTKEGGDMDKWAILKSKEIAIENGYIKPDGTEIRVLDQGPKGNPAYLLEKDSAGKLKVAEYLGGKPTGGVGAKSPYEYEWKKPASALGEKEIAVGPKVMKPLTETLESKMVGRVAPVAEEELRAKGLMDRAAYAAETRPEEIPMTLELGGESAPIKLERVPVGETPKLMFPEWLREGVERAESAKFAETLPEKTVDLEQLRDGFESYSLAEQEEALAKILPVRDQLLILERHSEALGLTPSQEDFIEMSKDAIAEMREAIEDSKEAFKDQLEDVGVSHSAYEKVIAAKGITVKDILENKPKLDEEKWGAFTKWVRALRPTPNERIMKVDDFLRSLKPENFLIAKF
ncbi:MAG: hypothetical protein V1885_02235 [Candidatus Brennerbacteria bacterium]